MGRHRFTLSEQLKAVEAALRSPKTPKQLQGSLHRRAEKLKAEIAKQRTARGGWLHFLLRRRREK
jgi:hypothetical protein